MAAKLSERLKAARRAVFVGRERENQRFDTLVKSEAPPGLLWLHGPGGVGKSSLLREWAARVQEGKTPSVTLDGRHLDPLPLIFLQGLSAVLGVPVTPDATEESILEALQSYLEAKNRRFVIFVDTFEMLMPLEAWLREEFLPALPENVLLVVAGRQAPKKEWSADTGWRELVHVQALRNLNDADATDYLNRRQVPAPQHRALLEFTHGHPLALSLVADVFEQFQGQLPEGQSGETTLFGGLPFTPEDAPQVVSSLLGYVIEGETSPERRAALEACALVRLTTEDLLAELLDIPDAHSLFEWLRGLSFIESGRQGLCPHDMAREVLLADLRWRNPAMHRRLHQRARNFYATHLNQGAAPEQQRLLMDYIFLHRHNPMVRPFLDWRENGSLLPGLMRPDEIEDLVAMVGRHEGEEAQALAAHWFAAQPTRVTVFRDPRGQIAGFMFLLSLTQAGNAEKQRDPATKAAWAYLQSTAPLRPGEESTLLRFWMGRDSYQDISPVQSLVFINVVRHYLTLSSLAYSFFSCATPEFWAPLFAYAGGIRLHAADYEIGGRHFGIYGHDWRAMPPMAWLDMLGEQEEKSAPEHNALPNAPLAVLGHNEYIAAVQDALRDWHRPDALRTNPLLRTRLVTTQAGRGAHDDARVASLQSLISEACESLREGRREGKFYRALYHGYLHPAPTQERAAEAMDVPFSTYRRHLKEGVSLVANLLWKRELGSAS